MSISVVIITHNNYSQKNGCVESVILSLIFQEYREYEIIIVDNNSDDMDAENLFQFISSCCSKVPIRLLKNPYNNISAGRNIGYKVAKHKIILFIDDDMIMTDRSTLQLVSNIAESSTYGYSANRQWLEEGWFEKNKEALRRWFRGRNEEFDLKLVAPNPNVRNKKNNRHLLRTYIGNFGFVFKNSLDEIGGWDENYKGYGCEDDDLALRLYLRYGRPAILKQITVAHVWHRILDINYEQLERNSCIYKEKLKDLGITFFHVGRLMYEEKDIIEYMETPLIDCLCCSNIKGEEKE